MNKFKLTLLDLVIKPYGKKLNESRYKNQYKKILNYRNDLFMKIHGPHTMSMSNKESKEYVVNLDKPKIKSRKINKLSLFLDKIISSILVNFAGYSFTVKHDSWLNDKIVKYTTPDMFGKYVHIPIINTDYDKLVKNDYIIVYWNSVDKCWMWQTKYFIVYCKKNFVTNKIDYVFEIKETSLIKFALRKAKKLPKVEVTWEEFQTKYNENIYMVPADRIVYDKDGKIIKEK